MKAVTGSLVEGRVGMWGTLTLDKWGTKRRSGQEVAGQCKEGAATQEEK